MRHVLLTVYGTFGDVIPMVRIGKLLKTRGHRVTTITNCLYEDLVGRLGLEFVALDTPEEFREYSQDLSLTRTPQGQMAFFRRHRLPLAYAAYRRIRERCCQGEQLLIGDEFGLGTRIAAEKLGIPLVRVFTAPAYLTGLPFLEELCRTFLAEDINHLRARVGLPPVLDWHAWLTTPKRAIGAWPDWFFHLEPDSPLDVVAVGFLILGKAEEEDMPQGLQSFLEDGEPPVLITGGTSLHLQPEFYAVSVEACLLSGRRGILVTRHRHQVPGCLPDEIRWFQHLPFAKLLPHVAAVIHHGGAGTLAHAMTAGIPQLALAADTDRPDNAARLERFGAGETLAPSRWQPGWVAEALHRLIESPDVRRRCQELARRVRAADPAHAVCKAIEDTVAHEGS